MQAVAATHEIVAIYTSRLLWFDFRGGMGNGNRALRGRWAGRPLRFRADWAVLDLSSEEIQMTRTDLVFSVMFIMIGVGLYLFTPSRDRIKCNGPVSELFLPCTQ